MWASHSANQFGVDPMTVFVGSAAAVFAPCMNIVAGLWCLPPSPTTDAFAWLRLGADRP